MKLTAIETKNYLARFYEALRQLDGISVGETGFILSVVGERMSPYLYNPNKPNQMPIYVAPAWSEHIDNNSLIDCYLLGISGLTYITVQYGHFNETVTRLPLTLKFDIKQDVAHFFERLNCIDEIEFEEPVDAALHVRINQVRYSSCLDD